MEISVLSCISSQQGFLIEALTTPILLILFLFMQSENAPHCPWIICHLFKPFNKSVCMRVCKWTCVFLHACIHGGKNNCMRAFMLELMQVC